MANIDFFTQKGDTILIGHECFAEVFKPILKTNLENEDVVAIITDLKTKGIVIKGNLELLLQI